VSVLLPNTTLGVRRRAEQTTDDLGDVVQGDIGPLEGPWPGLATENADGRWRLGLDPAAWPVRQYDVVEEDGTGRSWVVQTSQLLTNSADPTVNWVRIDGLQRVTAGTEPGGAEFVGRD
jgi:hypothetical protein